MGSYFGKGNKEESGSKQATKRPPNQSSNQLRKYIPDCPKYVLKRMGSMFFDADEDLAHEFYEEAKIRLPNGHVKLSMKRIRHNLQPQGIVDLPHPRLHVDYPVVIAYVGPS